MRELGKALNAKRKNTTNTISALSFITLPKGEGTVTRCPLVLRLVHSDTLESASPSVIIAGGEKCKAAPVELNDVTKCIEEIAKEYAPGEGEISDKPIYLEVKVYICLV